MTQKSEMAKDDIELISLQTEPQWPNEHTRLAADEQPIIRATIDKEQKMEEPESGKHAIIFNTPYWNIGNSAPAKMMAEDLKQRNILHTEPKTDNPDFKAKEKQIERDSTYYFLMSLQEPINLLPVRNQMKLRMKMQDIVACESKALCKSKAGSKK